MRYPRFRRMILNILPSCLSSAPVDHIKDYYNLNWQPRCSLLHLWLQINAKSRQMCTDTSRSSLEQLLSVTKPSHELRGKDGNMRLLMLKILEQSSLFSISTDAVEGLSYGLDLGDSLGDLLLRFIVVYL
jgi:hypothetical protein